MAIDWHGIQRTPYKMACVQHAIRCTVQLKVSAIHAIHRLVASEVSIEGKVKISTTVRSLRNARLRCSDLLVICLRCGSLRRIPVCRRQERLQCALGGIQ
jgi:predicted HNH restriction endonuclease